MTHDIPPTPREVVTTALEDWWLSSDPGAPFNPAEAADIAVTYLLGSGYTIHLDTDGIPLARRSLSPPSRASVALTAFLTTVCLAGALTSAAHHAWGWTTAGAAGTAVFAFELVQELAERRRSRT